MTKSEEMCMALLHAARTGDLLGLDRVADKLAYEAQYAGLEITPQALFDLLHVIKMAVHEPLEHLVATAESASYDPATRLVTDQSWAQELLDVYRHAR